MLKNLIALLCASSAAADYVVDWRVPQANDANANAWVADVVVPAGDKRRRGDVVAAARRVLKRFAADEHTYVEVVDAAGAGGSPKSVIIQSRRTGPMFSGIACRPCK